MVMGTTIIQEEVFREIVRYVLEEVEAVFTYEPKGPLAPLRGEKVVKPQINITLPEPEVQEEGRVEVDIRLAILYGASIPETVERIRQLVSERIELYTGYKTLRVDVLINRIIRFEQERSSNHEPNQTPSDH